MEQNSWVILGETSKFIRVSEQRMGDIVYSKEGSVIMQLQGAPQEVVTIAVIDSSGAIKVENVKYFRCTVPDIMQSGHSRDACWTL